MKKIWIALVSDVIVRKSGKDTFDTVTITYADVFGDEIKQSHYGSGFGARKQMESGEPVVGLIIDQEVVPYKIEGNDRVLNRRKFFIKEGDTLENVVAVNGHKLLKAVVVNAEPVEIKEILDEE